MKQTLIILLILITIFSCNNEKKAEKYKVDADTKIFDEIIKHKNKEWKGYANYEKNSDRENILLKIDSLDLHYKLKTHLPKEILECKNLKHLNLGWNKDIDWKQCFSIIEKSNIKSIFVSVSDLSDIDKKYWHYITGITIYKKGLSEFPKNIFQQKQLTYLALISNKLTSVPSEIANLENLTYLDLVDNDIESLPAEIAKLTKLTYLNLSGSNLSILPEEIASLTKLNYLDLSYNEFKIIPKEIWNFKNLDLLNLSNNKLEKLPKEIGELSNLKKLDLNKNMINYIANEIENLKDVTSLNLANNKLKNIPEEIGNLKKIKYLYLYNNQISEKEINKMKELLPSVKVN